MKNGSQNGRAENGRYEKGTNGGAHGKPGVSGRKPIAFKLECERINGWALLEKIEPYLKEHDPSDQGFRWACDWLSRFHAGTKPAEGEQDIPHERALELLA